MTAIAATLTAEPLWESAREMFARMREAIGEAARWAARAWITEDEEKHVRAWLGPLIAMVRKLVLIEAIALARSDALGDARARARTGSKPETARKTCAPPPAPPHPMWPYAAHKRPATLPLWPKPDKNGPRVRQLGPPLLVRDIWRERAREAQARHLDMVRFMREPPGVRLARRMEALARIIEKPLAAARRLAKKLRVVPKLALKLLRKLPRSRYYKDAAYTAAGDRAFDDVFNWLYTDTS